MARQGLRPDLRAAVHKAVTTGQPAIQRNVVVGTNGGRQTIDLVVHPIKAGAARETLYMVVFQDVGGIKGLVESEVAESEEELESSSVRQLEAELRATKERLQTTTEELESSNEELKSGNEELSSMNEELQSANEELETSKEELQSINEELQTVNAELNGRVEELSRANSDIANLLESTQIATVFLDRNLAVKSFTPAAKDIFHLVESDAGRPIAHVRARFQSDTVQEDAERVLRTLSTIERQVESSHNGAHYMMRMMPYRTVDNVIAGVLVTFVDVTRITTAEARIDELTLALRNRIQNLETLLALLPVGVTIIEDNRSSQVHVNRYGAQLLGEPPGEGLTPQPLERFRLFDGEREISPAEQPLLRASRSGEATPQFEGQVMRADGSRVDVLMTATPLFDDMRRPRGGIAALVDISERKRAEAHQQALLHELQHRVKNVLSTVSALATRMLHGPQPPREFARAFLGRLKSMARTHELLSRVNWTGVDLRQLVETAVRDQSSASNAITVEGPELMLTPNAASTLGMMLYELATNAAKYGALGQAGGRVEIRWERHHASDVRVVLTWTERDGPQPPQTILEGFGIHFIKNAVQFELLGSAVVDANPAGMQWTIEFGAEGNVQKG
jgi:two-component system CheB/CheR fusion protein